MLTILGNIRINNIIRLQHFKDSFNSFSSISDNWLINIRGTFRDEAFSFLRGELGDKLMEFNLLDDSCGWAKNALEMLDKAKYDYVLVWNEDHLNIAPLEIYSGLINEMGEENADILHYSFWCDGAIRKGFEDLPLKKMKYIDVITLTNENWVKVLAANESGYYLVSHAAIFKKDFLKRLFISEIKKLPGYITAVVNNSINFFNSFVNIFRKKKTMLVDGKYFNFINKYFFGYRLINFPKETPFDMERSGQRTDLLPIKFALPKRELFACIDFDAEPRYSLISRGLYKNQDGGFSIKNNIENIVLEISKVLTNINENEVENLAKELLSAQRIYLAGAGRVGLATKGFAMRLGHLGMNAYMLGDMNVPAIKNHDLLLISSGSGETQTIYDIEVIAKKNGARIALITGNFDSRMAQLADLVVEIKAPSKVKSIEGFQSVQPMTTLNEQCLSMFFDAMVLKLMEELKETHETMWARHSNLE